MRATRLAPLLVLLPLLVVRSASGESLPASTWPEKLSKEDVACLELLRPGDRLLHRGDDVSVRQSQVREAWPACQKPGVDARLFARAVRLRLSISELQDEGEKLLLLQEARRRLEDLPEPSPELFRILEELGSAACLRKDLDASIAYFESARQIREAVYGEISRQASEGRMTLALIHASGCETGTVNPQRARMYAETAVSDLSRCGNACRPAYLDMVLAYTGVLEELGLREGAAEISTLFQEEWNETPGTGATLERYDEPLPDLPLEP